MHELYGGSVAGLQPIGDLSLQETNGVPEAVQAEVLLLRAAHDRHVDLGVLQVGGHLCARDRDGLDARVLQFEENRLAGDLADRFRNSCAPAGSPDFPSAACVDRVRLLLYNA